MLTGTLLALVAALSWAFANLSIQSLSRRMGSWGALVYSQLVGGALAAVAAGIFEGTPKAPSRTATIAIVVAGIGGLLGYSGLFEALRRGQLAVVTPIIAAWSVLTAAIGVLRNNDPLSMAGACGILLVLGGNALLARSSRPQPGQPATTPRSALLWACVAIVGFGCMFPAVDEVGRSIGRMWAIPVVWAAELVVAIPLLLRLRLLPGVKVAAGEPFATTGTGTLEAGGFIALSLALAHAPVSVVGPIASLATAGSVLLGLTLLRERLTAPAMVGAVLACGGVALLNFE